MKQVAANHSVPDIGHYLMKQPERRPLTLSHSKVDKKLNLKKLFARKVFFFIQILVIHQKKQYKFASITQIR